MTTKTAVIYARVSDRKQAEEEVSVPAQIEACTRKADDLGAAVLRVFTDAGRSAFRESNRPTFVEAIDYATGFGADYFITWSSSRFARNRVEAAMFKRQLDRAGVALVYIAVDVDRSTDEGWMMDSMLELIDEMYSRQTSKDTRRSMLRNAQLGYFCGGCPPFGFRVEPAPDNPKRRKLVHHEAEALIVRRVFDMRARGIGALQIARKLNDEGIPHRSGRRWNKANTLTMLRSDAVAGFTVFGRFDRQTRRERPREQWVMVATHVPLVEPELWEQVQRLMDSAAEPCVSGSSRSTHAFTGILRCPRCDASLQIETGKGRGGKLYSYYACRSSQQGGECPRERYAAAAVDEWLSSIILAQVLNEATIREMLAELAKECARWQTDRQARRRVLEKSIADLQHRNSQLYDVLELHGQGAPNLGDIAERLRANTGKIKAAEKEIAALLEEPVPSVSDDDVLDTLDFIRGRLTDPAAGATARAFYQNFIDRIVLDEETTIVYDPRRLVLSANKKAPELAEASMVRSMAKWRPVPSTLRTIRVPGAVKHRTAMRGPGAGHPWMRAGRG